MNSDGGFLINLEAKEQAPVLLLAHGAGAPADSPFMDQLAADLAALGVAVWRFEFPYMQKRREDGRKRPPDRQQRLLECFREMIAMARDRLPPGGRLVIGGKSMGGRMATLIASDPEMRASCSGVVCFGYPFHPPGKPDRWRTDHFADLWCPALIIQGTRDPFGKPDEVTGRLDGQFSCPVRVQWLDGGNHDFLPPKRLGVTQPQLINEAAKLTAEFIAAL